MNNRFIGWITYYQVSGLEIEKNSHETDYFRITSSKYIVFIKNEDYVTIYPTKDSISTSDLLYVNKSSSLSFQNLFPEKFDLFSEIYFNKMIDRILSMRAFS